MIKNMKQGKTGKIMVMSTRVSLVETMLSIGKGETVEYSVFDFGIESARNTASYLRRVGKGTFSVSKTSPTTFSVSRID